MLKTGMIGILCFQLVSCGTILYPERRGQKSGRLDPGVVLFDAVGLFFFLIPGIIAYAVDFSTGAIYLPPDVRADAPNSRMRVVKFDPDHFDPAALEKIIQKGTGQDFRFEDDRLQVIRLENPGAIPMCFARFQKEVADQKVLNGQ